MAVPDVAGLAQSVAETNLVTAGLSVGTITSLPDGIVPAGSVISQSPAAGTSATNGTPVDLVVSTGATIPVVGEPVFQGGEFRVSVPTLSGRLYILEFADQLPATNWADVAIRWRRRHRAGSDGFFRDKPATLLPRPNGMKISIWSLSRQPNLTLVCPPSDFATVKGPKNEINPGHHPNLNPNLPTTF